MVGQVGTLPMSGVAVVGQLLFVYNLAIWGSTSGAGIFGAQFYGRGDMDGVRHTFRFKLLVSTAITAAAIMLFLAAGPALIGAYISADTSPPMPPPHWTMRGGICASCLWDWCPSA